jgi:hypothetical protein
VLRSAKNLRGFTISATDGDIGHVEELYFDDAQWTVRYFVVDTGGWLRGRRVLVSPVSVQRPEWERRRLPVALTTTQVEASPPVDTHRPISRQFEIAFSQYYGIPSYWSAPYMGGVPGPVWPPTGSRRMADELQARLEQQDAEDQHLRSADDIRGYQLKATDGTLGHVEDLLVEDLTWRIRYIAIDTRNWWPGKRVLVAPEWIQEVSWPQAAVVVSLAVDTIRSAPEYDPTRPIDRAYEHALYAHYGRPGYWEERAAA